LGIILNSAGTEKVSWGSVDSLIHGLSTISVAVSFKPASLAADRRVFQAFSPIDGFIARLFDADDIGVVFSAGGGYRGVRTNGSTLTTGSWIRVVCTIDLTQGESGTNGIIYLDGTKLTLGAGLVTDVGSATGTLVAAVNNDCAVGYDSNSTFPQVDGGFAEPALWNRVLTDAEGIALSTTASPADYPSGLLFHSRLIDTTDINDLVQPLTGTLTGGANTDHPVSYGGPTPLWAQSCL
jgi:hypothetical protein